ncbi:MAG: class II fructose-bisphosphate aldolase, partial [Candidatus Liptonbacteria bacterium]|nr:class II fructose-bisphosphate aldolase [Candidatus Liptonbacteria bacterium]
LLQAGGGGVAVGHFNISDLAGLKAIFEAAREAEVSVIVGTSEGEAEFVGYAQAAALVHSIRKAYGFPIFLNADHTHSLEKIKEAVEAGYDAVLFDGTKLPFEENVRLTKSAVALAKKLNPEVLVEGELGYIGSSSEVLREVPQGAALTPAEMTSAEEAKMFVEETGVDLFAPAVGNIHGIVVQEGFRERLNIEQIRKVKKALGIPLVLHGASGLGDDDIRAAIKAGINIVHINTELRVAWRKGMEEGLRESPDEVAPYKVYPAAIEAMKNVVRERLRLFGSA